MTRRGRSFIAGYLSAALMLGAVAAFAQPVPVPASAGAHDEVNLAQFVEVEVLDSREKYQRCNRSWKRRPDVGSDSDYPDLSARDAA